MTEKNNSQQGIRFLVIVAALVIIIEGINQAAPVLASFLVAVFLAIIGTPPVLWLKGKRVPSLVAVLIVVAGMITVLLIIGVVVGTSISGFSAALPSYQARLREQVSTLNALLTSKGIGGIDKVLLGYIKPEQVMRLTAGMLRELGSALSNVVLILLAVTFILFEASTFPIKLRAVLGDPKKAFPQVARFVDDIKRYMVIKTMISLVTGVLIWIWLSILGVDFPILWGFLAFLLHYVPNIGFVIAAVPAVLLTLIQLGAGTAGLAAAGYMVIDLLLGNLFETRFMGRRLGLSTLIVFLSLIFWGSLLGLIGMVLSVPFTMALKFACESSESTRWIAVSLGHELSTKDIPSASKKYKLSGKG
jgi:predicted PurR-regulated permease PerM